MHISPMDQVAEKESYPFVRYYKLLRMPIRAFQILKRNSQLPMQERVFKTTANIGFIGNGMTPTNHLGIQWFLENCWEDVQRQIPGVRRRALALSIPLACFTEFWVASARLSFTTAGGFFL